MYISQYNFIVIDVNTLESTHSIKRLKRLVRAYDTINKDTITTNISRDIDFNNNLRWKITYNKGFVKNITLNLSVSIFVNTNVECLHEYYMNLIKRYLKKKIFYHETLRVIGNNNSKTWYKYISKNIKSRYGVLVCPTFINSIIVNDSNFIQHYNINGKQLGNNYYNTKNIVLNFIYTYLINEEIGVSFNKEFMIPPPVFIYDKSTKHHLTIIANKRKGCVLPEFTFISNKTYKDEQVCDKNHRIIGNNICNISVITKRLIKRTTT